MSEIKKRHCGVEIDDFIGIFKTCSEGSGQCDSCARGDREDEVKTLRAAIAKAEVERDEALATAEKLWDLDRPRVDKLNRLTIENGRLESKLTALAAQEPVAWRMGTNLHSTLKDAEWDWRHGDAWENTSYVPEPLYAAAGAAPVPEGWKLVPVEPTQKMVTAYIMAPSHNPIKQYKAMLSAAPKE